MGTTGGHILGVWDHALTSSSNLKFQTYYDEKSRTGTGAQDTDTVDFDLQHNFRFASRQNIIWGFGHRTTQIHVNDTPSFGILPGRQTTQLSSSFVQDEITLTDNVVVAVGSKFERSSLTGNNLQPSIHVLWLPTSRQSVWAAASRAIRTANIVERGMHVTVGGFDAGFAPGVVELFGQQNSTSEALMAYEAGYRYQASRKAWIDLATFYNVYDNLSTTAPGPGYLTSAPAPVWLVQPLYFGNAMKGETYGAELSANYRVGGPLTLRGSYSLLRMQLHADPGTDASVENLEGRSPRHQAHVGALLNLPKSFEVSSHAYFTSSLLSFQVPGYTRLDTNIAWKGLRRTELSLIGQNLQGSHIEFGDDPAISNVVARSIFGRVTWKF
jgi:iron complex outermembrane receptor protein